MGPLIRALLFPAPVPRQTINEAFAALLRLHTISVCLGCFYILLCELHPGEVRERLHLSQVGGGDGTLHVPRQHDLGSRYTNII
jgi:hypothetical protein